MTPNSPIQLFYDLTAHLHHDNIAFVESQWVEGNLPCSVE